MKGVCLLVLLFASSALGTKFYSGDDLEAATMMRDGMERSGINSKIMESLVIQKIEDILNSIPTFTENANLTMSILNDTIRVSGELKNTSINGLDNHVIDQCKLSVVPLSFKVHIGLPNLNTSGFYDVDGLFGKIIPIYGKGNQNIQVYDISFFIKVDISSVSGQLIIKNIDVELSIGDIVLDLENFMGGDLGEVVTQIIEENFSEYLRRVMYWYGDELTNAISAVINEFLKGKTIDDILNWIQGKTTTPKPVTTPIPQF